MSGEIHEISHSIGRIESKLDGLTESLNRKIIEHGAAIDELEKDLNQRKGAWRVFSVIGGAMGALLVKAADHLIR